MCPLSSGCSSSGSLPFSNKKLRKGKKWNSKSIFVAAAAAAAAAAKLETYSQCAVNFLSFFLSYDTLARTTAGHCTLLYDTRPPLFSPQGLTEHTDWLTGWRTLLYKQQQQHFTLLYNVCVCKGMYKRVLYESTRSATVVNVRRWHLNTYAILKEKGKYLQWQRW